MSDLHPAAVGPSQVTASLDHTAVPSKGDLVLAALLSALLIGAGHLLVPRWWKGLMLLAFVLVFLLYARLRFLYTIIGAMAPFPVTTALCIFAAVDLAFAGKTRADTRSRGWLAVFSTRGLGCGRRTFD